MITPLCFNEGHLELLDQRILPHEEKILRYDTLEGAHLGIKEMVVRGAPLIGFTAIFGLALWAHQTNSPFKTIEEAGAFLISARPTAVNLAYEVKRSIALSKKVPREALAKALIEFGEFELKKIKDDNLKMANDAILELERITGKKKGFRIMTLCNTGYLACGPMGTALGVITTLHQRGMLEHVFASETRPYLQGARLTAYELASQNISHQIVVEGAASYILENEKIDAIYIGADRIARNGDTANKVGSSSLSLIAKHYKVPFYVVAPSSSFDLETPSGSEIHIELRAESEILEFSGKRVAPLQSRALNPSFDVTRAPQISAIFCEKGPITPVNQERVSYVLSK